MIRLTHIPPCRSAAITLVLLMLCGVAEAASGTTPVASPLALNTPLYFEANQGQVPDEIRFLSRGQQQQFSITPTEVVVRLNRTTSPAPETRGQASTVRNATVQTRSFRLRFVGANPKATVTGLGELAGKVNYLIGNEPAKWHTGIATFTQVRVNELYPGIGLVYYGNQQQLEYDFNIAPGTDPAAIALHFDGVDQLSLNAQGDLVIRLGEAEIRQPKPVIYQSVKGVRKAVTGGYCLKDATTVVFALGEYDHTLPLVIDPILSYSTFFGGGGSDQAWGVKVDASGNVYVAGETTSSPMITTNVPGWDKTFNGGGLTGDGFIAKFDNTGSNLLFFTYLGGNADDGLFGLDIDTNGFVYVAGYTESLNFPSVSRLTVNTNGNTSFTNLNSTIRPGFSYYYPDAFVAKLSPNGTNLIYSLFLGGQSEDVAYALAVDSATNVYVAGYTLSTNFPVVNGWTNRLSGSNDVFLTRISANESNVTYSTYFGGTNYDVALAVAADASGNAYVTGYTFSTNFPTTLSIDRFLNGLTNSTLAGQNDDAFVAKFDTLTPALVFSTFLGGSNNDAGIGITLDAANNPWIVGYTRSFDFPSSNRIATLGSGGIATNGAAKDAFLTKVSSAGTTLLFSTVFGGTGDDTAASVATDPAGEVFVTGYTSSGNFPTNSPNGFLRQVNSGGLDAFVVALASSLTNVLYSVYLGGGANDFGYGIAADPLGNVYVTGTTASGNFPSTNAFQSTHKGGNDAFLSKIILPSSVLSINGGGSGVTLTWPGSSTFLAEFNGYILESSTNLSSNYWVTVPGTPVQSNGSITLSLPPTNEMQFFRLHRQ